MKQSTILRSALFVTCVLASLAPVDAKQSGDDSTNNDPSPSTTGDRDLITSPTYAQTMEDAIRDLMEDFSHMTSLTEGFFHHPFFSRPRFGTDVKSSSSSSKPFSTWGSFGSLTRVSPRYEVIDDAKQFQVKMDVPGFHFHEMTVELESGGRVLKISGTKEDSVHETSPGEKEKKAAMGEKASEDQKYEFTSHTSTSFQQKFTLDPSIDTTQMTANLVDGVLQVRAPRKQGTWNKKHVPITQFDEDVWEELLATDEDEAGEAMRAQAAK